MKTCIAGIIAPFDIPYCREWIEYHSQLGIDEFILTLNDFSEEQETQIRRLIDGIDGARVRLLKMDGPRMQVPSYNQMLAIAYSLGADWCGFFDLDEFIKVRSTRKLKEILSDFNEYPALSFNWRIYGSNGIERVEEAYDPDPLDVTDRYSVQERFTKCQATLNIHVKQMINVSWWREQHLDPPLFLTPHSTSSISFGLLSEPVVGPFNGLEPGRVREIELAHYFCKSRQEYVERRKNHRRADSGQVRDEEELQKLWKEMDRNDIDENLLRFRSRHKYEMEEN